MHRNLGSTVLNMNVCVNKNKLKGQILHFLSFAVVILSLVHHQFALAQDVRVQAELSASTITQDESVTLSITAIGIEAELDVSSLDADFDVVGRSSSRQVRTVIGGNNRAVNTSVVTWTLELLPKGKGVFTVPAVKIGDYETQLLTLTVNDVPSGAQRDIFLEASVETTTPWVQSQVLMTLKVFQAIEIIDGGLDIPSADDLVVERLGDDTRERVVRDGREYSVTVRRFAMFPQKSGPMTIDPITLSVTIPSEPDRVRGFFSPTRKLTRRSDPINLDVQARPQDGAGWWLPATNLTLTSQWQGDPAAAQVDQPLTRTLVMRAEGVLDSQLPEINIPAIDGLSLYAEDPVLAMGSTASGLVAEQRINWALIPQRTGTLTLPAITLEWFNTLTGKTEIAALPEETVTITNSAALPANTPSSNSSGTDQSGALLKGGDTEGRLSAQSESDTEAMPNDSLTAANLSPAQGGALMDGLHGTLKQWQFMTMAAIGLWLLTLVAWFVAHRRSNGLPGDTGKQGNPEAGSPFKSLYQQLVPMNQIDRACKQADLLDIKRAVIEWAALQWPHESLNTLDTLQAKLPDGEARQKLARLQAALYSKQGYSAVMHTLAAEMASFPADLKAALQPDGTTAAFGGIDESSPKRRSRLPSL